MIGRYIRSGFPRSEATGVEKRSPGLPPPPQPPFQYDYFAAPTGTPLGSGTLESPWDIGTVIAGGTSGQIVPGKHIGYRGGQYISASAKRFTIAGQKSTGYNDQAGKIIHRNYNGEHVEWICDSASKGVEVIQVAAGFNWFWGIDAWRKHTDRYGYPGPGTVWYIQNASQDGVQLLHCHGHEGSNGLFTDSAIGNVRVIGCLFYHAGVSTGPRAHAFYIHHTRDSGSVGSRFLLSDCITFDCLGNCGQIFASGAPEQLDDIDVVWLITWGGGIVSNPAAGGPQVNLTFGGTDSANIPLRGFTARNVISRNPVGYGSANLRFYNVASTGQDAICEDAYLAGGFSGGNGRLTIQQMNWNSFQARRNTMIALNNQPIIETDDTVYTAYTVWEDNAFFGFDPTALRWRSGPGFTDRSWNVGGTSWKSFTGLGNTPGHPDTAQAALPSLEKVFVRPVNQVEYGRGHVVIFNWPLLGRIPVDLSTVLSVGDNIVVRNAQDYWGAHIPVYDAPSAGNEVTVWTGVPVYFPMTGVPAPTPYGFNNSALNAWANQFDYPGGKTAPEFDTFIVSTT